MHNFSEGFRSFREGFDRALIWHYWLAVKEHAWETLWGAGMVGLPFGILTLYYTPSWAYLGWLFVWVALVAGYNVWRTDHKRLLQRIFITKVLDQRWHHQDFNRDSIRYYFEIVNKSEALSIHGVRVQLAEISPEVPTLKWLPVLLRQKHDNPLPGVDFARDFDLNPCEPKHIDFVSAFLGDDKFFVEHIAGAGVNTIVPVSKQTHHRLKVMVAAEDTPVLFVWFDVWMNEAGILQCEMEANDDGKPNPKALTKI